MPEKPDEQTLLREVEDFRQAASVALLATADEQGAPEASHAPFVIDENGCFCLLISRLAKHTRNLLTRPQASLLLLENPADSANPFALRRLQFDCEALFLERGDRNREAVIEGLRNRFGRFVDTLNSLGDFEVVSLRPLSGKYVRGFAQTWTLSGENLQQLAHVNPAREQGGA